MDVHAAVLAVIVVMGVALVVGFFCLMMAGYYVPAYDGTDENGYFCSARRIAPFISSHPGMCGGIVPT